MYWVAGKSIRGHEILVFSGKTEIARFGTPEKVIRMQAYRDRVFVVWQEGQGDVIQIYDETFAVLRTLRESKITDISANINYFVISGSNYFKIVKWENA